MLIFILGGVKGGKSMFAQHTVKYLYNNNGGKLYYFATMLPHDAEDEKRIQRHIFDRAGWGFETVEESSDIIKTIDIFDETGIIIFDSLTAYVQNNIFSSDGNIKAFDAVKFSEDIRLLNDKVSDMVVVSDYIFSDALLYNDMTGYFTESLGKAHIAVANIADVVLECAFSNMKVWKNTTSLDIKTILSDYNISDKHLKYDDI